MQKESMCRREFRLDSFRLKYDRPSDFVITLRQRDLGVDPISGWYVTYRFLLAAFFLSVLVASGSTSTKPHLWFIYLTHLGFLVQTVHLVVSAALQVELLLKGQERMTYLAQGSWILYNVTNLSTLLITIVYWAFLFNPGTLTAMSFMLHAVNSIVSVTDIFIAARPYRLLHFYQPLIALTAYFLFTVIYWSAGGTNDDGHNYIYGILDWNQPARTVPLVVLGLIFLVPIAHALLWSVHKLRDRWNCHKRISPLDPVNWR